MKRLSTQNSKVVIEMSISDFLKLRGIVCKIYQLVNTLLPLYKFLRPDRKYVTDFSYLGQDVESVSKTDLEILLSTISYENGE